MNKSKEAIRDLRNSFELRHCKWAKNCLDTTEEEFEKKNKIIDELAARVYLTEEEREDMKKDIWNSTEGIPFSKWVKKYFERKVENE